jgi:hypothetical protein
MVLWHRLEAGMTGGVYADSIIMTISQQMRRNRAAAASGDIFVGE